MAVGFWTLAARQYAPRAAPYVPLVVLASPWMFYHWVFWEHTVALAGQVGSLLVLLWGWRRRRADALLAAGSDSGSACSSAPSWPSTPSRSRSGSAWGFGTGGGRPHFSSASRFPWAPSSF